MAMEQMLADEKVRGKWLEEEETRVVKDLQHHLHNKKFDALLDTFLKYHARRSETYMAYARQDQPLKATGETAGAEGYAGVALDILEARETGKERTRVLVVPNTGTLKALPEGVAIEVSCRINGDRLEPVLAGSIPKRCRELIQQVGLCERLVTGAFLEKSREKLKLAFHLHPHIGMEKAEACLQAFPWKI